MVIISVDQPYQLAKPGKLPMCYFKRELLNSDSVSLDLEKIISVLHLLFSGVEHDINIKYQY